MSTKDLLYKLLLQNEANARIATVCSIIHHEYKPLEQDEEAEPQSGQLYDTYENLIEFLVAQLCQLYGVASNSPQANEIYEEFEIWLLQNVHPGFTHPDIIPVHHLQENPANKPQKHEDNR